MRSGLVLSIRTLVCTLCAVTADGCLEPSRSLLSRAETQEASIRILIREGKYAEAQSSAEDLLRSLEARKSSTSSDAFASSLDVLVEARWRNGDASRDALDRAEAAVRAWRIRSNQRRIGIALRNLGRVLLQQGRVPEAVTSFAESVDALEGGGAVNRVELAGSLESMAGGLIEAGRIDDARRAAERALVLADASTDSPDSTLAGTLDLITIVSLREGRYSDARRTLERALAIRRQQPAHPDIGRTFALEGDVLWFEGRPAAARDAYRQCLAVFEQTLRSGHPEIAHCARRLGNAVARLGDMPGAVALFERAATIAERSLGSDHPSFAGFLNDLANAQRTLTDFRRARELYGRALAIREQHLGSDHPDVATVLYNLAGVSGDLGDLAEARRQFGRAIDIWRTRFGNHHPFVAFARAGLARTLIQYGRFEEALPLQREVLAVRQGSLGRTHQQTAETLGDLASIYLGLGRIDEAARMSRRALAIWEGAASEDTLSYSDALTLRGDILAATGGHVPASQAYTRALLMREKLGGMDHPDSVYLRVKLASAAARAGRYTSALENSVAAEGAARRFLSLTLRYLSEREALTYTHQRPTGLSVALDLAAVNRVSGPAVEQVFDSLVRSRALVFDEIAARRRLHAHQLEPGLASLWSAWLSARQRLANLTVRSAHTQEDAALFEEARREAERAERAVAERSASFRADMFKPAVGLREVAAALPQGSALVSFVRYDREASTGPSMRAGTQRGSYLAFVTKPRSTRPQVVPLGAAGPIESTIGEWKQSVMQPAASERAARATGDRLRRRIWDPLAPHIRDVERVFVIPDAAINLVSLAALPAPSLGYLVERGPIIHYLTAERDIVEVVETQRSASKGLMAFGGVAFDDPRLSPSRPRGGIVESGSSLRASCGSFQSLRFEPLAGTADEVEGLGRRWREMQTDELADVLTGAGASEAAFKARAPGHRVLHLATHGFILGDDCGPAFPSTRAVGGLVDSAQAAMALSIESPLLQTGLALAGANHRNDAKPTDEDGILTAEEVAALDLSGVEWAVLSACNTGLGEIRAGEGVFGLRRAFQVAGARTVIMSLWSVEDASTRDWMRALYDARLRERLDTATAVRDASLTILRARRAQGQSTHPFYWAAFVAAGDWR